MDEWLFKWRGALLAPVVLIVLFLAKPTLISYLIGILVALLGEALRIWAVGYAGNPTRNNQLTAPKLVTGGPYAHTRNPLYLGNCITALGFLIIACGGLNLVFRILVGAIFLLTYLPLYWRIILAEERFLQKLFGEEYRTYCLQVPRVFPRLSPYPQAGGHFEVKSLWQAESHTLIVFSLVAIVFALKILGLLHLGLGLKKIL